MADVSKLIIESGCYDIKDEYARNHMSHKIKISELTDITFDNIQSAINEFDIIDFDVDVAIGDNTFNIGSNKVVMSSNNSSIIGNNVIFNLLGEKEYVETTSYNKNVLLTSRGYNVNEKYLVKNTTNVFEMGYPNFGGSGSESYPACYSYIPTEIYTFNGSTLISNSMYTVSYGACEVYSFTPISNVIIKNITLQSYNTECILCENASNLLFDNVTCISTESSCIRLITCIDSFIKNCTITSRNTYGDTYYTYNSLKLVGCYNIDVGYTVLLGAQAIDVTYDGVRMLSSYACNIHDCSISGTYTGITAHPGVYGCKFYNNHINSYEDGISLRGSQHEVYGNYINHINTTDSESYGIAFAEGCLCMDVHDNIIIGYQSALLIQELDRAPFSTSGVPYFKFNDNVIQKCDRLLYIALTNNSTTVSLYGEMCNNQLNGNFSSAGSDFILLYKGTRMIQYINILNTTFCNYKIGGYMIKCDNDAVCRRFLIDIISLYSSDIDKSSSKSLSYCYANVRGNATITTSGVELTSIPEL